MFEVVGSRPEHRHWMRECDFQLIREPNEMFDYFSEATTQVGLDFETDGLNLDKSRIVGFSFAHSEKSGRYYPVSHLVGAELNLPIGPVKEVLQAIDQRPPDFARVWYNFFLFDGAIASLEKNLGWEPENWDDALIAVFLENTNHKVYNLKDTAMRMLGIEMITFEEVTQGRTFDMLHPGDQETVDYASSDAAVNLRLWNLPTVKAARSAPSPQNPLGQAFIYELEKKVGLVLRHARRNKCFIDPAVLEELRVITRQKIAALEREIYALCGREFDIGSPIVLGRTLLELGVPIKERTGKSQQVETKKEILAKYKKYHPAIEKITQWKELSTQNRNYTDKLEAAVSHFGPAIAFAFTNIGVPTGRMKAGGEGDKEKAYAKGVADLNPQSTPDPFKQKYLPNIRAAFVANDPREEKREWAIVASDYAQVELRVAANLSREPTWTETFNKGGDIHLTNAKLAYRRPDLNPDRSKEEKALRDRGKTLSFAILYGGSAWTVADHGGIAVEQAELLVENFFGGAKVLKAWIDSWIKLARKQKLVKTAFGRVRHLDEFYKEEYLKDRQKRRLYYKGDREAVNSPIQGGAADVFKIACVKVDKLIKERKWQNDVKMILFMHDELVFRVRLSMLEQIVPELQKAMEFDVKGWPVKLATDVEAGWSWGSLMKYSAFLEELKKPQSKLEVQDIEDVTEEELEYAEELREAMDDYGYRG